jgi:hypothetical protein
MRNPIFDPYICGAAMSAFTLVEFAAKLVSPEAEMKIVDAEVIRRACEMVCAAARDVIGVPQPGWPALSAATRRSIAATVSVYIPRDNRTVNSSTGYDGRQGFAGPDVRD